MILRRGLKRFVLTLVLSQTILGYNSQIEIISVNVVAYILNSILPGVEFEGRTEVYQ